MKVTYSFPINVGDVIYYPCFDEDNTVLQFHVTDLIVNAEGLFFLMDEDEPEEYAVDEIGKTVFLTEEEARKAFDKTVPQTIGYMIIFRSGKNQVRIARTPNEYLSEIIGKCVECYGNLSYDQKISEDPFLKDHIFYGDRILSGEEAYDMANHLISLFPRAYHECREMKVRI